MPLVVLRGGSRDGESTDVDEHVERLLAASEAPGLIDIYEATDETAHSPATTSRRSSTLRRPGAGDRARGDATAHAAHPRLQLSLLVGARTAGRTSSR